MFDLVGYRDLVTGAEHVALVSPWATGTGTPLVRLHSECLTGDVFGSQRCDCGPQLERSLARVAAEGGVVVYLRGHEGRGMGLLAQAPGLRAAGPRLRHRRRADSSSACRWTRVSTAAGAAILADLGIPASGC